MNVLDQVEKLIDDQRQNPQWADAILFELREIKRLLQDMQSTSPAPKKTTTDKHAYFAFVNRLRKELRADIQNGNYPEIRYQGKTLGVNFKGHIYDKATAEELPAHEAFSVYRFLFDNREKLDSYIIDKKNR